MASTHDHNGTSASPNSSEEVESHHGTPATKLSPFSPDQGLEELKHVNQGIVRARVPPPFVLARDQSNFGPNGKVGTSIVPGSQDPFLSVPKLSSNTQSSGDGSKLSPNASSFTPTSLIESVTSNDTFSSSTSQYPFPAPICGFGGIQGLDFLSPTSRSNPLQYGPIGKNYVLSGPSDITNSPTSLPTGSSFGTLVTNVGSIKEGQFSTDVSMSRSLMVSPVGNATSAKEVEKLLVRNVISPPKDVVFAELATSGRCYLRFADIRDSDKAYRIIKAYRRGWDVQYISPNEFAMKSNPEKFRFSPVSNHEGQVVVKVKYAGLPQHFDAVAMGYRIKQELEKYGHLIAFEQSKVAASVAAYLAEYSNVNTIDDALSRLNDSSFAMCTLSIAPYQPDLAGLTQRLSKSPGPLIIGQETSLESDLASMSPFDRLDTYGPETSGSSSYSQLPYSMPGIQPLAYHKDFNQHNPPSSHHCYSQGFVGGSSDQSPFWSPNYSNFLNSGLRSPIWSALNPGAIGQERGTPVFPHQRQGYYPQQNRGQNKIGGRQSHDHESGNKNFVDIERIRKGIDVRTTIMLRNIPNKVNEDLLKKIVNETSFGKYDFMYLRIDFANNCNVGYAFINFEDPYSIIDFINTRAGRRWGVYYSDKIAEVSYATIQGRDCLVQKFRNSSVMLELPSFRPKLYHTGTGPLAGKEENFPGPDNPSKMRRSVENAEHVGLFAPRAGQNFRDEQRRRRSQYDRGTRLAEIEDSYGTRHHESRNEPNGFHAIIPYGRSRGPWYPGCGGTPSSLGGG